MRWQLISLDLDGTLVDTAAEIAEAANRTLAGLNLPRQPLAQVTLRIGQGAQALMRGLLLAQAPGQAAEAAALNQALQAFDAHYAALAGQLARPYAHALPALQRLRAAGLKLACVTNKELHHTQRLLTACGLADHFDLVVGGDSLAHKKPHASVLRHVARRLGCATAGMAHVGDSATDIAAARNAGVAAWAVPYGYNAGVPVGQCGPDQLFADLGEMARHVLDDGPAVASQGPAR